MLWVIFALVVIAWLTWLLMPEQEAGAAAPVSEQVMVGLLRLREKLRPAVRASSRGAERGARLLGRAGAAGGRRFSASARLAFDRRSPSARPDAMRFGVQAAALPAVTGGPRGDGWRPRLIALLQLILFVVLVGALFAGVFAAAALRFTRSGA
jgi:hypothetical protein